MTREQLIERARRAIDKAVMVLNEEIAVLLLKDSKPLDREHVVEWLRLNARRLRNEGELKRLLGTQ